MKSHVLRQSVSEVVQCSTKQTAIIVLLDLLRPVALQAGVAHYAEQTKILLVQKAVSGKLLMFLISWPIPTTYEELKRALREIDNNTHMIQHSKPFQFFNQPRHHAITSQTVEPIDLDAISNMSKQPPKWVSPEDIQRRRLEQLCLRCSALEHPVKSCPYLPARRPQPEPEQLKD